MNNSTLPQLNNIRTVLLEAKEVRIKLESLAQAMRKEGHNLYKSFSDHPIGCIYCEEDERSDNA